MVSIRSILLSLLSALLHVPAASQAMPVFPQDAGVRLVSKEEGEAVVWVAWELRRGLGSKPDCSHFVNIVYARAGLDYDYANTGAIFDGIDAFRRVQDPQPGDLVAWKGHVGLVVDPDEHSFYSSVRSGFAIENYRSDYWTNRGQPRFFRYLIDDIHSARLSAHLRTIPLVLPATTSTSSSRLLPETHPELRSSNRPATPHKTLAKPSEDDNEIADVIFVSSHARPSTDEIRAALIHLADANRDPLPELRPTQSIVVADQVAVNKLDLYDRSGWVELVGEENGSSACSQPGSAHAAARWRVTLRREDRGWILLAPRDRIYLRREAAAQVLEHRAATGVAGAVERSGDQAGCVNAQ